MNTSQQISPAVHKPATQFKILVERSDIDVSSVYSHSDNAQAKLSGGTQSSSSTTSIGAVLPLTTSKMANHQSPSVNRKMVPIINEDITPSMDKLTSLFHEDLNISKENFATTLKTVAGTNSTTIDHVDCDARDELSQLKLQLEAAQTLIARQNTELSQQKLAERAIGPVSNIDSNFLFDYIAEPISALPSEPMGFPVNSLGNPKPSPSMNGSFATSPAPFDQFQGPWGNGFGQKPENCGAFNQQPFHLGGWNSSAMPPWPAQEPRYGPGSYFRQPSAPQSQRRHILRLEALENDQSFANPAFDQGYRKTSSSNTRPNSATGPFHDGFNTYVSSSSPDFSPPMTPMLFQQVNAQQQTQFQNGRPIGTPLSPTAVEFSGNAGMDGLQSMTPWNTQNGNESTSTYIAPMEPMNYRRLLDRNMSCNWSYIVDKIVCSNDQQASIFLQQKLKLATPEQKYELIEAIVKQAYPLMINRFGNFLIQRCFEHGSPDQVIAIAKTIQGHVLNLSTDAFGCHVVQKAFDVVPDDYKAVFVHELLRNIPETVIHRYACHVWQKLFELRWADSPPQIMKYVNEALRGMWHEVALGETGSLVVQNIFENCLEEDKRPCINEVLAAIDIVSHGQFGNWCIQHISVHGAPADKSRAIEHILRYSTEYSIDQFASKVIEKCLKVSGSEFLERYLERVCEARPDRPRMPLIDIAGDQYGNYLVQYILINANPHHREIDANHVRKHMVSLRGSKFGSRVAMLCCNPASLTRPGPPMGVPTSNRYAQSLPMAFSRSSVTGAYR